MKLRNKKTGDICELNEFCLYNEKGFAIRPFLKSLAELNEEWEDYKPQCWYIAPSGEVREGILDADWHDERKIGNYFETKEEAKEAVEKLKALKRLKNKGFRFDGYDVADRVGDDVICGQVYFKGGNYDKEEIEDGLYLLFGGEE